jgi:hypothetical protein
MNRSRRQIRTPTGPVPVAEAPRAARWPPKTSASWVPPPPSSPRTEKRRSADSASAGWNFVPRTQDEINVAYLDWTGDSGPTGLTGRFGRVASRLPRIDVGPPPWTRP